MFPIVRVLIGLVFLISGFEKLLGPYQNFAYVLEAYQIFPPWAQDLTARIFPWVELFTGLFAVLGLWGRTALTVGMMMCSVFILIVGQALLRGLPIDQCGCFGELIHIAPKNIILFDSVLLLLTAWLLRYPSKIEIFSLDRYFSR